jgi:NAD(P)-dependent dehydrogenase (short-subunit alcohol dehydrogenase family)
MFRFNGKVVLVTGASAGIGKETALAFAREGASVVLGDVNVERGREVEKAVLATGGKAVFAKADVSLENDCKALVDLALSKFGRLDCAVNNAGIEQSGVPTVRATIADFERVIHTNVLGVLMCMKHQIPPMIERGGGAIVNISSIAGLIGFAGAPVYVASKHAVLGLTKTAALEHAKDKIRINAVCPGAIQTEMIDRFIHNDQTARTAMTAAHPLGRFGTPAEVAAAILWLCAPESSFVTGQHITVDGGYTAQ